MTERHDPGPIIDAFFELGPTVLPEPVYRELRLAIDRSPRRVAVRSRPDFVPTPGSSRPSSS